VGGRWSREAACFRGLVLELVGLAGWGSGVSCATWRASGVRGGRGSMRHGVPETLVAKKDSETCEMASRWRTRPYHLT
jgi:hypothetical protein